MATRTHDTGTDAQAEDPRTNGFTQALFTGLPARYDRLAELLSLGQNARWRREMVTHVVPCALTLDVATGTAGVALQLTQRGAERVVGIDLTEPMLHGGQAAVAAAGPDAAQRITFVAGTAERLPFGDATFDALTFTYLLRYVSDPAATLRELARVVRPGAPVASLEFLVPKSRFWRGWWWLFTRLVLPVAGGLTGGREWYAVGRFLGPNISRHYRRYPLDWTVAAWRDAGFVDVHVRRMSLGGGLVMWGRRAGG